MRLLRRNKGVHIKNIDIKGLSKDVNSYLAECSETQKDMVLDYTMYVYEFTNYIGEKESNILAKIGFVKNDYEETALKLLKKNNLTRQDMEALELMSYEFRGVTGGIQDISLILLLLRDIKSMDEPEITTRDIIYLENFQGNAGTIIEKYVKE